MRIRVRPLIKLSLLVLAFIFVGLLLKSPIIAQEDPPACSDVWGYEAEDSNTIDAADDCRYAYNSCKSSPYTYDEGYAACVGSDGGCWDIGRWAYTDTSNCPIRADLSIDYEGYSLNEGFTFWEANRRYCECVADCMKQYRHEIPCQDNYETCCASIVIPEQGTIGGDDDPLVRKPDDIADDLSDKCQEEDKNLDEIEGGTRELLESIRREIAVRTAKRTDLTSTQKETLNGLVDDLVAKAEVQKCGEGSLVKTCQYIKLNFGSCLYIDPMSSPDIIRHEIGHIVAETFINGYQYPSGNSSHAMLGYSSDQHRALDEALANLISIDLVGGTRYVTFSKGSVADPLLFTKDSGQDINFDTKVIEEYRASRDSKTLFDPSSKTKNDLEWYGIPDSNDKVRNLARKKMDEKLAELKDLSQKDSFWRAITGAQAEETKAKLAEVQKYSRMLYPPAYSSRNELAIAFLLYDLLGDSPQSYRLGGIINSANAFSSSEGRGPKSELELLNGYVMWQQGQGQDRGTVVTSVLDLATGENHRRNYFEDDF